MIRIDEMSGPGAIAAFVGIEAVLFQTGIAEGIARFVFSTGRLLFQGRGCKKLCV